jgi:hypothetical protein
MQHQPDTFDLNPFAAMSASDSHNSDFWYYVRCAENAGERVSTAVTFSCIFGLGKSRGTRSGQTGLLHSITVTV